MILLLAPLIAIAVIGGAALLLRAAPGRGTAEKGGEFGAAIQQAFGNELGILPAAWAS